MNKEQLFESLNELDDQLILRSEKPHKPMLKHWLAAAACLCLVIASVGIYLHKTDVSMDNDSRDDAVTYEYVDTGKFHYNSGTMLFASEEPEGSYSEQLTQEQLAYLLPETMPENTGCTGYARFFPSGKLNYVRLVIKKPDSELELSVRMAHSLPVEDYVKDMKPSKLGEVEYVVLRDFYTSTSKRFGLQAVTRINDTALEFNLHGQRKLYSEGNLLFEEVLTCFAVYADGKPDLSGIVTDNHRFGYYEHLSLEQALQDEEFGSYIPAGLEADYSEYDIKREIGETENRFNTTWYNDSGIFNWNIRWFSAEYDEPWLISVSEREKYDRSLHPLPWPAGMTDEEMQLLESPCFLAEEVTLDVVKARAYERSYDGKTCIEFTVKYKNVSIHIAAYGAEPEYVYEQLMSVCGK